MSAVQSIGRGGVRGVVRVVMLSVLCSTACFEASQEVWIREDHTGRIRMAFGISEALLMFGDEMESDPVAEMRQGFEEAKRELDADPNVLSCQVEEYSEEGLRHVVLDVEFKRAERLVQDGVPPALTRGALFRDVSDTTAQAPESTMQFRRMPSGNVEFVYTLALEGAGEMPATPDGEDPMAQMGEAMGRAMLASMFANRAFTVTLHAPHIVNADGRLTEDRTTVVWSIPLAEIIAEQPFHREFRAEYEPPINWQNWILFAAVLWIGFMVMVVGASRVRRQRLASPSGAPPS